MEKVYNLNHLHAIINEEGNYNPKSLSLQSSVQIYLPKNKLVVLFFMSFNSHTTQQITEMYSYLTNQQNDLVSYFIIDMDSTPDITYYFNISDKYTPYFMLFYKTKKVKTIVADFTELQSNVNSLSAIIQNKHTQIIQEYTNSLPFDNNNNINNNNINNNINNNNINNNDNFPFNSNIGSFIDWTPDNNHMNNNRPGC